MTDHECTDDRIPLKVYVDQRFTDLGVAVQTAQDASERALGKADAANEKRFDGVNEFRMALADQQRLLISRTEFVTAHEGLQARVDSLEEWRALSSGSESGSWRSIERLILVSSLIAAIAIVFVEWFRH